jgi:hypothetical protein
MCKYCLESRILGELPYAMSVFVKKSPLLLLICSVLFACSHYPAARPPASAYNRPVRPPGWTTGVDSVEELRRISPRPTAPPLEPQWSPAERAYALAPIQQSEEREAYYERRRAMQDANRAIEDQLSEINQSIRDLPMQQYIWGD